MVVLDLSSRRNFNMCDVCVLVKNYQPYHMLPLSLTKRIGFIIVVYKRDRILLVVICDFFYQRCELSNIWNGFKWLYYDMLFIVCKTQVLWLFSVYLFYNWCYRVRVLMINSRDQKVCIFLGLFFVYSYFTLCVLCVCGRFCFVHFVVLMKIIRSYIMQ